MPTYSVHNVTLILKRGDIVEIEADAIVNAANSALAGGGGVDGAIHRAAGPSVMAECRRIGHCPTGSAVVTGAGKLKADYIFHAVGPVYHRQPEDARLLASAYQACLDLAEKYQVKSMAFPAISTGVYGYPASEATPIALGTVIEHLKNPTSLQQLIFAIFDDRLFMAYENTLQKLLTNQVE